MDITFKIKIKDVEVELTLDELKELKEELDKIVPGAIQLSPIYDLNRIMNDPPRLPYPEILPKSDGLFPWETPPTVTYTTDQLIN